MDWWFKALVTAATVAVVFYALTAQRGGIAVALMSGLVGALVLAEPALLMSDNLLSASVLALVTCTVAVVVMPGLRVGAVPAPSAVQAA